MSTTIRRARIPAAAAASLVLAAVALAGQSSGAAAAPAGTAAASAVPVEQIGFQPVAPARLVDTRGTGGPIGQGAVRDVQVTGLKGVPATGVGAVALNVTAVEPTKRGYLTVWPSGTALPPTSTVNFSAGQVVANNVIVGPGGNGRVSVRNQAGSTNVVLDVTGWFPTGRGVTSIRPDRYLDTRETSAIGEGQTRTVRIGGVGAVPASATAVTLTVTATETTKRGYLTLYPTGKARPGTSSVNFTAGQTVANSTIATLGSSGQVSIYNHAGSTDAIVDVTGYLDARSGYVALPVPVRIADTRSPSYWHEGAYPRTAYPVDEWALAGWERFSVIRGAKGTTPALPFGASSAVLNVTAVTPPRNGYVTVWPSAQSKPATSTLNFTAGATVANGALVGVSWGEGLQAVSNRGNTAHVVVDVSGFFPVDGVGVLGDPWVSRQYSGGTDRIGVLFCEPTDAARTPLDRAQVLTNLSVGVGDFFRAESRGAYSPEFVDVGRITPPTEDTCLDRAVTTVPASAGVNGVLVIDGAARGPWAWGLAGPGVGPDAGRGQTYPANYRDGIVSANSVIDTGSGGPYYAVTAHELGHMLALMHAYRPGTVDPYSNPMDLMSGGGSLQAVGTTAVARFREGWIAPSEVQRHGGGTATYEIAPVTRAGTQLVVVPGARWGSAVTLGARADEGYDVGVPAHGVEITYSDELDGTLPDPYDAPAVTTDGSTSHVLGVGQSRTLGGVTVQVVGVTADGRWRVTVTGSTAMVPELHTGDRMRLADDILRD